MTDISQDIRISQINANVGRGGWMIHFDVANDSDIVARDQRVSVVWRPSFGSSFGELRTVFNGFALPVQTRFNARMSDTSLTARTSDYFLESAWCQGINFVDQDTTARANYHEFDSVTGGGVRMTMGRIVQHLLGYYDEVGNPPATNPDWVAHTNMVYHASLNPNGWISLDGVVTTPFVSPGTPNGSQRVNLYVVKETDNLWNTLRSIASNEFFVVGFDKTDTLYYKRHPMFLDVLPGSVITLTNAHIIGEPSVLFRDQEALQQLRLHAVTEDGETLHAYYPDLGGLAAQGRRIDISRIRCSVLTELQRWAYYRYHFEARDVTVRLELAGFAGLLFEMLDRVAITYTGDARNGLHIDWTDKYFWIHDITVNVDEQGSAITHLTLEAENV